MIIKTCRSLRAILIPLTVNSTVFREADSVGIMSGNGTWNGMTAHVISGTADIGVSGFYLTKERSEVVAFTNTLGFLR